MSHFVQHLMALFSRTPTQRERDEAYLNESVDICDVERRMAEIDQRSRAHTAPWQTTAFNFKMH